MGKSDLTKPITLAGLAEEAIGERFDHAFMEALENTLDLNRDPEKARRVVLTVTLVPKQPDPNEVGRPRAATMVLDVKAVLVPLLPTSKAVHFGRNKETGQPVALLIDPGQHEIFADDQLSRERRDDDRLDVAHRKLVDVRRARPRRS